MTLLKIAVVILVVGDLVLAAMALSIKCQYDHYRRRVRLSNSYSFARYYVRAVNEVSYEVVRGAYIESECEAVVKRYSDDDAEYNLLQAQELCDKLNER